MKELDIKLERYLDLRWAEAPEPERAAFRRLLEAPDPDIWSWLLGRSVPEDVQSAHLMERLQEI